MAKDPVKSLGDSLQKILGSTGKFARTMSKLTKDTDTLRKGFRLLSGERKFGFVQTRTKTGKMGTPQSIKTGRFLSQDLFNQLGRSVGQERLKFMKELTKFIAMPLVDVGSTGSLVSQAGKAFPNLGKRFRNRNIKFAGHSMPNIPSQPGIISKALSIPGKARGLAGKMFQAPFKMLGQGFETKGGKKFGGAMRIFTKGISHLTGIPTARFKEMGKAFKGVAGAGLKAAGMGMLVGVLSQLLAAFNPLKPLIEALTTIVSIWGEILGTALIPIIEKLYDVLLSPEMMSLWERLANVVMLALDALMPLIDIVMPILLVVLDALVISLEVLIPLFPLIEKPLSVLSSIFELLAPILDLFLIPLKLLGPVFELLTPIIEWLITPLEDLEDAFGFLGDIAETVAEVIDGAIGWISDTIEALQGRTQEEKEEDRQDFWDTATEILTTPPPSGTPYNFLGGFGGLGGYGGYGFGGIPLFANGGIVSRPTLGLIGEAGPEAVVPLEQYGAANQQQITINMNGYISENMVIELEEMLKNLQQRERLF